ncbi:MAG: C39 family peptidase [Bacilli bacterium]|nr:C39 family peptidase [Bacilli bacterium]
MKLSKYLKLFIIMFLALICIGCTPSDEEPDTPDGPALEIPQTDYEFLVEAASSLNIPNTFTEDYAFIRLLEYKGEEINVSWKSDKTTSISNFGVVKLGYYDEEVILTATFKYKEETYKKEYKVMVPAMSIEARFNEALKEIEVPNTLSGDIKFITEFYDEEMKATWSSSHPEIISNEGVYKSPKENTIVTLTVLLEVGSEKMEKSYEVNVISNTVKHHLILNEVKDYNLDNLDKCHVEGSKLVLNDNETEGTYLSEVFEVAPFKSVVASWGALSSKTATAEIEVRVRVDGKWSMYFSYGAWGLGLENKPMATNTNDGMVKISTDEIIVMNNKTADAIQYRVTLRRNETLNESPKLSFVAMAIEFKNYEYKVDTSVLPKRVEHIVPKLNQNVVPVIGNSICSPTSSTMLLKYKGHSFAEYDEFENRYIANLARDYGNEIFGNWVYCTVIMTAYGEKAYVMRMYSLDELKEHLANVGPVALSVKGKMDAYDIDNTYTTGGHLLVCQGYYEKDGKTIFICNDPNVKSVYVEYTEDTIERVWRMVSYVVE